MAGLQCLQSAAWAPQSWKPTADIDRYAAPTVSPLSQHRGCWFRSQGMRMTWPQKSINDWHWIQSEMLKSSRVLTKCRKQTFHHWQLWICSLLGTRTGGSRRPALLSFLRSNVSWIEELRPIEIHFSFEEAGHELSELSVEMLSLLWQGHSTL